MKRVAIIGYPGVATAFAAAAIAALQRTDADVQAMSIDELRERAIELAPADLPIYTDSPTVYPRPRFTGYMKARHNRR